MLPISASLSMKIPSYSNSTIRVPSAPKSIMCALSKGPLGNSLPGPLKITSSPGFSLLPGLTITSHLSPPTLLMSRNSTWAPPWPLPELLLPPLPASLTALRPNRRAGMTLLSFSTRQSPSCRYSRISKKCLCSILTSPQLPSSFLSLCTTRSLDESRLSAGFCAINLFGNS